MRLDNYISIWQVINVCMLNHVQWSLVWIKLGDAAILTVLGTGNWIDKTSSKADGGWGTVYVFLTLIGNAWNNFFSSAGEFKQTILGIQW